MNRCAILFLLVILHSFPSIGQKSVESANKEITNQQLIKIPGGKFQSFYEKKETGNVISVDEFSLNKYAVTNQQFLEFVKENPKWSRSKVSKLFADVNYLKHWAGDLVIGDEALFNSPVVNVSWFAANAYCRWAGNRLPSTSEWEYAASQEVLKKDKKDTTKVIDIILSWYAKPNRKIVPSVGSAFENIFRVNDMHGLIWEWTSDFNSYVSGGDSRSSDEIERNLFCASGSFGTVDKEDYAAYMRFGFRGSLKGNYCIQNLGFRCARDLNVFNSKNK